jgi:hypothetical protein
MSEYEGDRTEAEFNAEWKRREALRRERVARAIGRVVNGQEIEPKKNWLKAADAAIAAYHEGLLPE